MYERWYIPAPGRPLWQGVRRRQPEVPAVDVGNADRAAAAHRRREGPRHPAGDHPLDPQALPPLPCRDRHPRVPGEGPLPGARRRLGGGRRPRARLAPLPRALSPRCSVSHPVVTLGREMVTVEALSLFAPPLADEGFHPAVAAWFARRFPDGPTPAQHEGWQHIAAGDDTLIAAPTGSGKTLAGFLVGIDELYRAHARGVDVGARPRWPTCPRSRPWPSTSPRTWSALREIAGVAAELGYDAPDLRVAVRTGDTTTSERAAMVRRPPNFVVTTPESLYLLVTAARSRAMLATVETVIVDEIHAVARDKRGSHLALTLERLERAAPPGPSASACPPPSAHRAGGRPAVRRRGTGPCAVVDTGHRRRLDLALELPQGELEPVASAEQMGDVVDRIADLVAGTAPPSCSSTCRRLAERLAHQLGELGDDVVAAHHGRCPRTGATGSRPGCGPATCGPWWPPPRWSWASTSVRSSWCARSARPAASPPSCSGWAGPTTAATACPGPALPHPRRAGRVRRPAGRRAAGRARRRAP